MTAPLPDLREGAEAWVTEHVSCPNPNCKRLNLCAECMTIVSDLRERDRQWRDMVVDALARLAEVERGRAADVRRLGVATGRRFIPEERITDIDVVEHAMVTVRVQAEAAKEAIAAAEQRLARLRPLVRAVILWERLRGDVGELEARIVMLNIIRNHFDPTDRAWSLGDGATEEER